MKNIPFYFISIISLLSHNTFGYGEKVDTLLIWQERAVHVLTNACRMAPIEFRDRYIGNNTILLTENYQAVPPLYWNRELNAVSRLHCVQMAIDCGMSHSCNGQTFSERVRDFYTKGGFIGENIAEGYRTPQQVISGWLIDGPSAENAAPDGNGDGHRENIMSPRFTEMGCGFYLAGSDRNSKPYWCQDFGGGKSSYTYHPIPAASHLFFGENKITFMANLYDTTESVTSLTLLINSVRIPLELDMGTSSTGTYSVTLPLTDTCRMYFFELQYSDGSHLRFPENGNLITSGEGNCEKDFTTSVYVNAASSRSLQNTPRFPVKSSIAGNTLICNCGTLLAGPVKTIIVNCRGEVFCRKLWHNSLLTIPLSSLPKGIIFLHHVYNDGTKTTSFKMICR